MWCDNLALPLERHPNHRDFAVVDSVAGIDDPSETLQLRPSRRICPAVPRRRCVAQHLLHRPAGLCRTASPPCDGSTPHQRPPAERAGAALERFLNEEGKRGGTFRFGFEIVVGEKSECCGITRCEVEADSKRQGIDVLVLVLLVLLAGERGREVAISALAILMKSYRYDSGNFPLCA